MPKRVLEPYVLVNAQSLGASFTSPATSIKFMDRCAIRIVTTGTPTGALALEGSVDGVNFVDLQLNLVSLPGSPNDYLIEMSQTALVAVRVTYTRTSGTGTMTVTITAKES